LAIVGIDLGTTNSLVAVWRDGHARIIENVLGQKLTPSVVGRDENGQILVGQAAKERLITHPEATTGIASSSRCSRLEALENELMSDRIREVKKRVVDRAARSGLDRQ
jgi:molecular chaperone DnaK (HSP70)